MKVDHPALVAVVRHGLATAAERPTVVADDEVDAFRVYCRTDRISGLAAAAINAGTVQMSAAGGEGVAADWHEALKASVILEALLVRTAARFDELGARWAVTKGTAVAHLDFDDPGDRCFGDVDVVVHPGDWERVISMLAGGIEGRVATRRFTAAFGKGETVSIDGMELDLHRRFAVGRFGVRSQMVDCFEVLDSFVLAGRMLPALSPAMRLVHACFHATLGGGRGLRALRDVAQIALVHHGAVDEAMSVAERWDVAAVVAEGIMAAWGGLRLDADHPVAVRARRVRVGRADRRALKVFATDDRFRSQAMTAMGALPWHARPRFVVSAAGMLVEARR